jgi:hypothetical protein
MKRNGRSPALLDGVRGGLRSANTVACWHGVKRNVAFVLAVVAFAAACGSSPGAPAKAAVEVGRAARALGPRLEDAFDGDPALLLVIRPTKLTRDPLYGPLIRRASELASARVAVGEAVGTTALAALERTDEIILGAYDRDARDAVIALRGVPADVEASHVLDTTGKPLWVHLHDLSGGVEELAPSDPNTNAALFVLPRRAWIIAVGGAATRARTAFVEGTHPAAPLTAIDEGPLVVGRLRGSALLRARPSLANGALAPLARDLDHASLSLEPGPEGAVGEVVARFVYGDTPFAERAEQCANDVLAAFTHKLEATAPWLHAVTVSRAERAVIVRGRIPRAWADGLLHIEPTVDLDALAK